MDASNMLKPALARGELHVIGATTIDEYRKNIEKDAALERRFQPVLSTSRRSTRRSRSCPACATATRPTTASASRDEAIVAAAELSDRYISDRFLPDKAIDLIDQAPHACACGRRRSRRDRVAGGRPAPARARARPGDRRPRTTNARTS